MPFRLSVHPVGLELPQRDSSCANTKATQKPKKPLGEKIRLGDMKRAMGGRGGTRHPTLLVSLLGSVASEGSLLREVHAAQEGLEAGVGAEGVVELDPMSAEG